MVAGDGPRVASETAAADPGQRLPGLGRRLTVTLLTLAAVAVPAAATGLFGLVVGVDLAQHRGGELAVLPARLDFDVWIAGLAAVGVALGIALGRKGLRRLADDDLLRAALIGLCAAAVVCTLASLAWPL